MAAVVITEIKETKKGRYALFCAQGFLFSVDEDTFVRFGIKKGASFTGAQMEELHAASDLRRAQSKALDLLGAREHAERELAQKLEKTFDPETAAHAVARMRELGLTDDAQFARRYAEELVVRKGKSKREAAHKLYEKGIARELAAEVLAAYGEDESAALRALIDKKYRTKLMKPDGRQAVYAALLRKGFSSRDVRAALDAVGGEEEQTDFFEED